VATETAKFALELDDGISASSESAEDALQSLQSQIDKDAKALTQMKKAMRQMQAAGSVDVSAYRKLKGEIDATQDSIGKARASFINLGGDFSKVGKKTSRVKLAPKVDEPKGLTNMLSSVNALPGPLSKASKGIGGVQSMITGLTGAMGLVTAAIVGVVAILVVMVALLAAVAVATAKATAALLKYAAAQADAMRSERLRLEGLGTLRRWMRLTATDAAQMSESINRVSERVPLARAEVASLGQELHRIGIRGRAAEDALEALSIAQAVQGEVGRRRLMMLVRQAGHSEGAMADLSARVRKELGGVAGGMMQSLGMLSTKLGESFRALFTGINLAPLLSGLFRLSRLLSQSTESGRALRAIMTAVLGPFIDELGGAATGMEYFLKELVILALRVAIVFMQVKNSIQEAFGTGILGRILRSHGAMEVFRITLIAIGLVVAVLAAGVAILVFAVIGLFTPFLMAAWAIYRIYLGVQELKDAIPSLLELFSPELWIAAGQSMIDGIIAGLGSGMARLRAAVTGLGQGAMTAFRTALGIHSPSAVFAQFGLAIPQGIAEGVERGTPEATGAVGGMMSTTTNVASTQGGQSRAVTTGDIHIHVGGEGEGAEDTARRVTDALRDFFETGLATEPA
jgi:prefoldin subunit 5